MAGAVDAVNLPPVGRAMESVRGWSADDPALAAALQMGPAGVPGAVARLGLRLVREDRPAEAADVFRAALALSPDEAPLWNNLGAVLDRAEAPEASICLQRSLELSPVQPDVWLLLGTIRKKRNDLAGAEAAYAEALRQDPKSALAWQCTGVLRQEKRDFSGAIESFLNCARLGLVNAALLANLGKLYYQCGRIDEAFTAYDGAVQLEPANGHYRQMVRKTRFLSDVIAGKNVNEAVAAYLDAMTPDAGPAERDVLDLLKSSFTVLSGFGHQAAAVRVGEKRLAMEPASATAKYLLAAVGGAAPLRRSPDAYIVEYFDSFAESFDTQLVNALGYDMPDKLGAFIKTVAEPGRRFDTLDAGCGTGLCGRVLRPLSKKLVGVDLSPKMLERAAGRGTYDELVCGELATFLEQRAGQFDLIAAADVLIYFGDVGPFFRAAAGSLRPGGLLAFSTESMDGGEFKLQASGRFAHSAAYVRAAANGFSEGAWAQTVIRLDANKPVPGHVFVFRRNG